MRHAALVAALLGIASVADAAPKKKKPIATKPAAKVAAKPVAKASAKHAANKHAPIEKAVDVEAIEVDDAKPSPPPARHRVARQVEDEVVVEDDETPVRQAPSDGDDDDVLPASSVPPGLTERVEPSHGRPWHLAIGPYLWASSVSAKVSIGGSNVASGLDFNTLEKHAKFGLPLVAEADYKKLSAFVDMQYGVIGIDGAQSLGPVMASVDGAASALAIDAFAGYSLVGDSQSMYSLEVRGGLRYSKDVIAATLGVQGSNVFGASTSFASYDALAGARAVLRPWRHLSFSGNADYGLFGSSSTTWSAEIDALVSITSHVLITAGYRTLTSDGALANLTMFGPRAAFQVQF